MRQVLAVAVLFALAMSAEAKPNICGTLLGFSCSKNQFCDFPKGAMCGAADQGGVCRRKPKVCAMIYAPVCGCDDKTYSNACMANGAGVSVLRNGKC